MLPSIQTELPVSFYSNPDDCRSLFSTQLGKLPKRSLQFPLQPSLVYSNFLQATCLKAAELQRDFPDEVWNVSMPSGWLDLYEWFDAVDIHIMGASFLIQVLRRVHEQNEVARREMESVICETAAHWISTHSYVVENSSPNQCLVDLVEPHILEGLKPPEIAMFSQTLQERCHQLRVDSAKRYRLNPPASMAIRNPMAPPYSSAFVAHGGAATQQIPPFAGQLQSKFVGNLGHEQQRNPAPPLPDSQPLQPGPQNSFNRSVYAHGQPSSRPMPQILSQRPRGYSTLSNRPQPNSPGSKYRRHSSNYEAPNDRPEPIYVWRNQRRPSNHSPSKTQPLIDPAIITQKQARTPQKSPENIQIGQQVAKVASVPRGGSTDTTRIPLRESANRPPWPSQDVRAALVNAKPPYSPVDQSGRHPVPRAINDSTNLLSDGLHDQRSLSASSRSNVSRATQNPVPTPWQTGRSSYGGTRNKTITFDTCRKPEIRDETGRSTMFIREITSAFFGSREFKDILDQYGEVQSMTHCPGSYNVQQGYAFIHYTSPVEAARAIEGLAGYNPQDGPSFVVKYATPRGHGTKRVYSDRSGVNYTDSNQSHDLSGMRSTRHVQSIEQFQPPTYQKHQYTERGSHSLNARQEPLTDGFEQQLSAVTIRSEAQQGAELAPVSAHTSNPSPAQKETFGEFKVSSSALKENIPFPPNSKDEDTRIAKGIELVVNPSVHGPNKKHNKKKTNKKPSEVSTQSTPTKISKHSKSMGDLQALFHGEQLDRAQDRVAKRTDDSDQKTKQPKAQDCISVTRDVHGKSSGELLLQTSPSLSVTPFTSSFVSTVPSRTMSTVSMYSADSSFHQHVVDLKDVGTSCTNSIPNNLNRIPEKRDLSDRASSNTPGSGVGRELPQKKDAKEQTKFVSAHKAKVHNKSDNSARQTASDTVGDKPAFNLLKSNNDADNRCINTSSHQVIVENNSQVLDVTEGANLDLEDEVQFPSLSPPAALTHQRRSADEPKPARLPSKINGSPTRPLRSSQRSHASQSKITVAVPKIREAGKKQTEPRTEADHSSLPQFLEMAHNQGNEGSNILGSRDWPFVKRFREA